MGSLVSKASIKPDKLPANDNNSAFEETLALVGELVESVQNSVQIRELECALKLLQDAIINEAHVEESQAMIQWNLLTALVTRFGIFGWSEDLEFCPRLLPGTNGFSARRQIEKRNPDGGIEEIQLAIQHIEKCRKSIDIDTLDTITCIAEEAISSDTGNISAIQNANIRLQLGYALVMKYLHQGGIMTLDAAADTFREAERFSAGNVPFSLLLYLSLEHVGWLSFTECGHHNGLLQLRDYNAKARELNDEGSSILEIGKNLLHKQPENAENLQNAIDHLSRSLSYYAAPHPLRLEAVMLLADALHVRFQRSSELQELEKVISLRWEALALCRAGRRARELLLHHLSIALFERFKVLGSSQDLDNCVSLERECLDLRSTANSERHSSLRNLVRSLLARFLQQDSIQDLNEVVPLLRELLSMPITTDQERSIFLKELAKVLANRFDREKAPEDLDEFINLSKDIIDPLSVGHSDRALLLPSLADALHTRFDQKHILQDLEECIALYREAASLGPTPLPDHTFRLVSLAGALFKRFQNKGTLWDLDESIILYRQALNTIIPSDLPTLLNNLGSALSFRFDEKGNLEDLEDCISLHKEALSLRPAPNPERPSSLDNLASALFSRSKRKSTLEDLNECIKLHQEALGLRPALQPDRLISLHGLANAFSYRFERAGIVKDLDDCVALRREALNSLHENHPDRLFALVGLASDLSHWSKSTSSMQHFEECISLYKEVLRLQTPTNPSYSGTLGNFAKTYLAAFESRHHLQDLEECISLYKQTLPLMTAPHPRRHGVLNNLGIAFCYRFDLHKDDADMASALLYYEEAAHHESASMWERLGSARNWAKCALLHNPSSALSAYRYAIDLLPQLASVDLTLDQRKDVLHHGRDLVNMATKWAIIREEYETAVLFLSIGRSIFWTQALQLRTPVDDLASVRPDLADKYIETSRLLEATTHSSGYGIQSQPLKLSSQSWSTRTSYITPHQLAEDRKEIIHEIRRIKGFEEFLTPPSFSSLQRAASMGPVVLLNATKAGTDALIVRAKMAVQRIPIADISSEVLEELRSRLRISLRKGLSPRDMLREDLDGTTQSDDFRTILEILWENVAKPVIEVLGIGKTDSPPRIWWCPTGSFASLPIHASGIYSDDEEPVDCLFQYVLSSYCTSLQDLLHPLPQISKNFKMLAIIEPEASGAGPLPAALNELAHLVRHTAGQGDLIARLGLQSAPNHIDDLLSEIQESSFVHFGCHGTQHLCNPLESYLLLSRDKLTMSRIIKECHVRNGALAYLSACETAKGDEDQPDESLNLAAAMMFAGFRSVVGTLWSIFDSDAPVVADVFYGHLFRKGATAPPDVRDAAYGLHLATKEVRDRGRPFSSWVPYVHYGV